MTEYKHEIYGTAEILIRDPKTGMLRKGTPEEVEATAGVYREHLARSFSVSKPRRFGKLLDFLRGK